MAKEDLEAKVREQLSKLLPDDFGEDGEDDDDESSGSKADVIDALTPQLRKPNEIYIMQDPLRPTSLDEIVGQEHVKKSLTRFIDSAARRDRVLDHVMFTGGPGLGKTTFASVIAAAQGSNLILDTGPALTQQKILDHMAKIITQNEKAKEDPNETAKCTLFIDELHAIPREAKTILLPIMEDFNFLGMHVPEFTLIGATTDESKIDFPMRERFGITYDLHYYTDEEIYGILRRSYGLIWGIDDKEVEKRLADVPGENLFGFPVASEARLGLESIARRCCGVPRTANKLLKRVFDWALDEIPKDKDDSEAPLTPAIVEDCMREIGVDAYGLTRPQRKIITTMFNRYGTTPKGIANIASACGFKVNNVEEVHEPNLVRLGFINRDGRGRVLTDKGVMLAGLEQLGETPY